MSTPSTGMPSTSLAETRQQLDELETLIRQMLALPAEPVGNAAPPPAPVVPAPIDELLATSSVSGSIEKSIPLIERVDRDGDLPGESATGRPHFAVDVEKDLDESDHDALSIVSVASPRVDSPESVVTPSRSAATERATPEWRPHAAAWLLPLIWFNRSFDRVALRFGRPGQALVHERGRNVLGWIGLTLCVAAAAWAFLDWVVWSW